MNAFTKKTQGGFALLIFMVMLMGAGGLLIAGFSQGVLKETQKSRYEHNKRVLQEAKRALLMYAYNYPSISPGRGPGRLPCPDLNDDGISDPFHATKGNCMNNDAVVGRVPYLTPGMNLRDARDASGELLWYAVSSTFDFGPATIINSNSTGTISIFDQSGSLIYDGTSNGIAAVIIAPGVTLSRDENDDGVYEYQQVRTSVAEREDPRNYLDTFNDFDNSVFINGSDSEDDGFILGPVRETDVNSPNNNTVVVNDQMIVITAAEVIEMAEKATLQAYRDALRDYQQKIWGTTTANYRYPWLDPYESADGLASYDADINTVISDPVAGRVPSMFRNYFFAGPGPQSEEIDSQLYLSFRYNDLEWTEVAAIDKVKFDPAGNLVADSNYSWAMKTLYFWDGHDTNTDPNSPNDGTWELCTGTAGTGAGGTGDDEDNCNRKTDGSFKTPADLDPDKSDVWLKVRRFDVEFNSGGGSLTFPYVDLKSTPPTLTYTAPDASNHALVYADYDNGASYLDIDPPDSHFDNDFKDNFDVQGNGPAFGINADDRIRVGIRFYPELPAWALDNQWHDNVMFAYSSALKPDGDGNCTQPVLPFEATTNLSQDYCLVLENSGGITTDKSALLFLAGSNPGFVDDGPVAGVFYAEELEDIFEGENGTPAIQHDDGGWSDYYSPAPAPPLYELLETNLKFDRRPSNDTGNDLVLVLD